MVAAACRWTESAPWSGPGAVRPGLRAGPVFWQKAVLLTVPAAFVLLALAEGLAARAPAPDRAPRRALVAVAHPYVALFATSRSAPARATASSSPPGDVPRPGRQRPRRGRGHVPPALLGGPWGSMQTTHPLSYPAPTVTTIVLVVCASCSLGGRAEAAHPSGCSSSRLPTPCRLGVVRFSTRAEDIWDVMALERYFVDPIVVAMLAGA